MTTSEKVVKKEEPEYTGHKEQLEKSSPTKGRTEGVEKAILSAFEKVIKYREVPFIQFGDMNAAELAQAFLEHPKIIKPTLSCINVAGRAIHRDLGINFDTYSKCVTVEQAQLLAGYIKPMLPPEIALPALMELDRYFFTDKEMRAEKGNWEVMVTKSLNASSDKVFRKRKFKVQHQTKVDEFEIDAAYPAKGDIQVAIDVKRIESPRDIHKRVDEIVNKAVKFKSVYPNGKFFAFIYYPFPNQQINILNRLQSADIDGTYFAGATESSVKSAVDILVAQIGN